MEMRLKAKYLQTVKGRYKSPGGTVGGKRHKRIKTGVRSPNQVPMLQVMRPNGSRHMTPYDTYQPPGAGGE